MKKSAENTDLSAFANFLVLIKCSCKFVIVVTLSSLFSVYLHKIESVLINNFNSFQSRCRKPLETLSQLVLAGFVVYKTFVVINI